MQHLKLHNISFQYDNSNNQIFTNLNLDFGRGWSSIIGQNGSGKTTLLKLIAKKIKSSRGTISGNQLVYYCEQILDELPEGFEEFRDRYNAKTFQLKELLGIKDEWMYRWETLSFGEQKRIQLAVALFSEPDILLLDEPTNHLDHSTKEIVINTLKSFQNIGILVSHDRELLENLCTTTIIIKNGKTYRYKTSYQIAMDEYKKELEALRKESENQNKKIKALQKNIQFQKEKVSRTKSRLSKREIDKKDSSTKEKINLAKFTGRDQNESKKVDTLNTKYEHLNAGKIKLDKEYKKGISIQNRISQSSLFPIVLKNGELKLGGEPILSYPDITVNAYDKIGIMGDNGTGKSTFIRYLLSTVEKKDILYLPQEIDEVLLQELFETINELSNEKKGELFTYVTRLSSNPKKLLDHELPSPGELKKLLIAKAMLENISMIVLDEPTNHMDIDSILALEEALKNYCGTVILISHDRVFLENIVQNIWRIEGDTLFV